MDGDHDGRDCGGGGDQDHGNDCGGDGDGDGDHDGGAGSSGGGDQDHGHDCGVDREGVEEKECCFYQGHFALLHRCL